MFVFVSPVHTSHRYCLLKLVWDKVGHLVSFPDVSLILCETKVEVYFLFCKRQCLGQQRLNHLGILLKMQALPWLV